MTLRALAKEYANGTMKAQEYRKARDELLDGITSGRIKIAAREFQAPIASKIVEAEADITAFRSAAPKAPQQTPAEKPSASAPCETVTRETSTHTHTTQWGLLIAIAVIIICLIILIALYPYVRPDGAFPEREIGIATTITKDEAYTAALSEPGESIIKQFLRQNDWTGEKLREVISQWQELSAEEQAAALLSPARSRLVNAIHRKLGEEQALLELGEIETSIARQRLLVDFSNQLGINDQRLTVKEIPE